MTPKCGNIACLGGVRRARVRSDAPPLRLRRQRSSLRDPREPFSHEPPTSRPRFPVGNALVAQGLGARGHHRGNTSVQCMRPPVRAPPAPRPRARAARFLSFSFGFSNEASSRLRFPVFETRAFPSRLQRDTSPPRAPRSGAAMDRHPLPPGRALTLGRAIAPHVVPFRHRYKRGWFCSWCTTVYRKPEEEEEPRSSPGAAPAAKLWVGCDRCDRWSHLSCELANDPACLGRGREVAFAEASRSRGAEDDPRTTTRRTYHCPSCRARNRGDVVDADRDPSWASPPLSRRRRDARLRRRVAHRRPYLRERERVRAAETHAETHAETRKRERRRRGRTRRRRRRRRRRLPARRRETRARRAAGRADAHG